MEDALLLQKTNIARQFFPLFERGDVAAAIDLFFPDALYWIPAARRESGMTEFAEALRSIRSRLKGIVARISAIHNLLGFSDYRHRLIDFLRRAPRRLCRLGCKK